MSILGFIIGVPLREIARKIKQLNIRGIAWNCAELREIARNCAESNGIACIGIALLKINNFNYLTYKFMQQIHEWN